MISLYTQWAIYYVAIKGQEIFLSGRGWIVSVKMSLLPIILNAVQLSNNADNITRGSKYSTDLFRVSPGSL